MKRQPRTYEWDERAGKWDLVPLLGGMVYNESCPWHNHTRPQRYRKAGPNGPPVSMVANLDLWFMKGGEVRIVHQEDFDGNLNFRATLTYAGETYEVETKIPRRQIVMEEPDADQVHETMAAWINEEVNRVLVTRTRNDTRRIVPRGSR